MGWRRGGRAKHLNAVGRKQGREDGVPNLDGFTQPVPGVNVTLQNDAFTIGEPDDSDEFSIPPALVPGLDRREMIHGHGEV